MDGPSGNYDGFHRGPSSLFPPSGFDEANNGSSNPFSGFDALMQLPDDQQLGAQVTHRSWQSFSGSVHELSVDCGVCIEDSQEVPVCATQVDGSSSQDMSGYDVSGDKLLAPSPVCVSSPGPAPDADAGLSDTPLLRQRAAHTSPEDEEDGDEDEADGDEEEEDDDKDLKPTELKMKRQAGGVWIPIVQLRKMDKQTLRARQAALQTGVLTDEQRAVLEWQRQRVKNREGAAQNRRKQKALRDECECLRAENAELRAQLAACDERIASLKAHEQEHLACIKRLESTVSAFHSYAPYSVLQVVPTAVAQAPAAVAPALPAFLPVMHPPATAPAPATATANPPARKRLRTPALFFLGMLVLVVLVAQLTLLEARTNPASGHPLARTFHAPRAAPENQSAGSE